MTTEPAAETVTELTAETGGVWLVTTQGSAHVWDLDNGTYERRPGAASLSGAFAYDGTAHRITRVDLWPVVGKSFMVWFDDPEEPRLREQWRQSSTVASIARVG